MSHPAAPTSWDERFANAPAYYGQRPNEFFAEALARLVPGRLLLVAEGQGRNALHAARNGWAVVATDASPVARAQALYHATLANLPLDYHLAANETLHFPEGSFDAIGLVYAHMPTLTRIKVHRAATIWLRPGGTLILEAFAPAQLGKPSGGPKDPNMLYTVGDLQADFAALQMVHLENETVALDEGTGHRGKAAVVRMVAQKPR